MTRMHPCVILLAAALLPAACTTTPIPVDLAEAQCVQTALYGGSNSAVTVGIGTGYGGWGYPSNGFGWGGTGVAMTTQLPQTRDPASVYNNCVVRKSGKPPVTPFAKRPELKG